MEVTFAATQFACTEDAATNVASDERLLREAVKKGAQVILLQELFETPYFCKDHLASHFELARAVADSPVVSRFRALARELGVVVPLSVFERSNNAYYNSLVMIDADGEVLWALTDILGSVAALICAHFPDHFNLRRLFFSSKNHSNPRNRCRRCSAAGLNRSQTSSLKGVIFNLSE